MKKTSFPQNYAIPPGVTLQETLETIGMTQAELANRIKCPEKTIDEIMAGEAPITPRIALLLQHVLGIPASFWINLEENYQETKKRAKKRET